jgi:hypothetical protein
MVSNGSLSMPIVTYGQRRQAPPPSVQQKQSKQEMMMQDLAQRIKIEREVDRLAQAKDFDVASIATQAKTALKRHDYKKAGELVKKAKSLYQPPRTILQVIVDAGKARSAADARRIVEQSLVQVDGILVRRHDLVVEHDQAVTLRGEEL